MQFPCEVQAALLFDEVNPFEPEIVVQEFMGEQAEQNIHYKYMPDTKPGVFYRIHGSNDVMVTVELVEGQADLAVFDATLSSPVTRQMTPDVNDRLARHKSHLLICVHHGLVPAEENESLQATDKPVPGNSMAEFRQRLFLCGTLSAIANRMASASLVHWVTSDILMTGEMFSPLAMMPAPSPLHIHPLLFKGGEGENGKPRVEVKTHGAAHFIGREIHVMATSSSVPDVMRTIFSFLNLATGDNGSIIPDGETFDTEGASLRCRVQYIAEDQKSGYFNGPLFQLEILQAGQSEYTPPATDSPEDTADDDVSTHESGPASSHEHNLSPSHDISVVPVQDKSIVLSKDVNDDQEIDIVDVSPVETVEINAAVADRDDDTVTGEASSFGTYNDDIVKQLRQKYRQEGASLHAPVEKKPSFWSRLFGRGGK